MVACLQQHVCGNWGELCDEDRQANIEAVANGLRILSVHPLDPSKALLKGKSNVLWIITEADRSVTTFLLPEEY